MDCAKYFIILLAHTTENTSFISLFEVIWFIARLSLILAL